MTPYAPIMLAAGLGIPVLAALNAALGARLDSPALAALILFLVALIVTMPVLALTTPPDLANVQAIPRHLFLGGCFVAFYVLSVTFIAPKIGVGNAVFFVILGQIISAAIIDHFGLFGARATPLSLERAAGIGFFVIGIWLTQRAQSTPV